MSEQRTIHVMIAYAAVYRTHRGVLVPEVGCHSRQIRGDSSTYFVHDVALQISGDSVISGNRKDLMCAGTIDHLWTHWALKNLHPGEANSGQNPEENDHYIQDTSERLSHLDD